jgi:hypothetical protein
MAPIGCDVSRLLKSVSIRLHSSIMDTDYKAPFPFTGTVKKALVDVTGEAVEDQAAKMRMYLSRQ